MGEAGREDPQIALFHISDEIVPSGFITVTRAFP
jgi:hypothetical protein